MPYNMMDFETSQNLAKRLAAYIPVTLTRQLLTAGLPNAGEPRPLKAATLFADMSGFTAMSEDLASDGLRGAEEVNRVLLLTFTGMIDLIHRFGGAISHFYGDAMSVYFPDEDEGATHRAIACAQMMQVLMMTSFNRVVTNRPREKDPFFNLSMKVGVGYGTCQELVVGTPELGMEFVLTGQAVDEATEAEHQATAGDVIVSQRALKQVGKESKRPFTIIKGVFPMPAEHFILQWDKYDQIACEQLIKTVQPFIPPTIYNRLIDTETPNLAEHRPSSSLFVQFEFEGSRATSDIEVNIGQQLNAYYLWASQVVRRFGAANARVNRVLTGDKGNQLHIIFGAPVAPDAPEQAGRCALALQREQPSYIIKQHIGFTAGKVFAGPVGSDARREYTIVGALVNLSARLMQHCPPDHVWTDRHTAKRVQDNLETQEMPEVDLKGKGKTIPVRILRDNNTSGGQLNNYIRHWKQPQVGREQELQIMQNLITQAMSGKGQVLRIWGNTGVGKTRFVAEGVRQWLEMDGEVMIGSCQPHTEDVAFTPWQHIWGTFFGLHGGMDTEEQVQVVINYTQTLVPSLADDASLWADLLGLSIPQSETLAELTAEVRQARLFHLMRRCLKTTSDKYPILLVIEDLHWADQASLKLIDELAKYIDAWRGMIIVTHRPTLLPLATVDHPICTSVNIGDISATDGRELLYQLLGYNNLPPLVEQHLGLRDREGRDSPVSPLFLEESLQMMTSQGVLSQEAGRLEIDEEQLRRLPVPDSIHSLLLARLDRLPANNRDLLQVASVIGRQFTLESLDRLTPTITRPIVDEMIESLSEEQITQFVTRDPEWTYLFQHAMTHEVVYESLPFDRRQQLHEAVANWLAERYEQNLRPLYALLAYHYTQAKNHENGLTYALKAADAARDIFANEEAVDLYTLAESHLQALDEEERWETIAYIYIEKGKISIFLGNLKLAYSHAKSAYKYIQSSQSSQSQYLPKALLLEADVTYRQAQYHKTKELAHRIIQEFDEVTYPEEFARAYLWSGLAGNALLQHEKALLDLQKAEKISRKYNFRSRLARVLEAIGMTYGMKNLTSALDALKQSASLSRLYAKPANIGFSLNNVAYIQFCLGQVEESLATYNESIQIGNSTSKYLYVVAMVNRATVHAYIGDFSASLLDFQTAISHLKNMNQSHQMVETYLLWAYDYHATLGFWDEAFELYNKAEILIQKQPDNYPQEMCRLLIGLGQLYLHQNNLEKAQQYLKEASQLTYDISFDWWKPSLNYHLSTLHIKLDNYEQAKLYIKEGLNYTDNGLGCADYKPILLLNLATITNDESLFIQATTVTKERAKQLHKIICFFQAGTKLQKSTNYTYQVIGQNMLVNSEELIKNLKGINKKRLRQIISQSLI